MHRREETGGEPRKLEDPTTETFHLKRGQMNGQKPPKNKAGEKKHLKNSLQRKRTRPSKKKKQKETWPVVVQMIATRGNTRKLRREQLSQGELHPNKKKVFTNSGNSNDKWVRKKDKPEGSQAGYLKRSNNVTPKTPDLRGRKEGCR